MTLCVGWSRLEGHRVHLSDIPAASTVVTDFQPETPAVTLPRAVFLDHLTAVIQSLTGESPYTAAG